MHKGSFLKKWEGVIKPTCPSCHKGGYSQRKAADGRPEFVCGSCDNTWTCGTTGGIYARLSLGRRSHKRRSDMT